MNIYYFEHYPHMYGTKEMEARIDPMDFAMLLALSRAKGQGDLEANDVLEELNEDYYNEISPELKRAYAFHDAIADLYFNDEQHAANIMRGLNRNGFFVGEWEEGTYLFAYEGFEEKAKARLYKREGEIYAESM